MSLSLAIKYRPTTFEDLTEQSSVVTILTNQIETDTIKHAYLFCGGAGTGKTTSARIFANMINEGSGTPIELDAASNNSVDDIRQLCEDALTQSIDCEYKVFIIDECHSLSNQAWQAMLKTLEEPPAKSIFILCTTNPEKIPQTILSRVQRYNFQRISYNGIVNRLNHILMLEDMNVPHSQSGVEYIAKIADGGMRDAITLMDKCLSYSSDLTLENVIKALGVVDYEEMFTLTDYVIFKNAENIISTISSIYSSGLDLKLFVRNYFEFILDLNVYATSSTFDFIKVPNNWADKLKSYTEKDWDEISSMLEFVTNLQFEIKWDANPKPLIISRFLLHIGRD